MTARLRERIFPAWLWRLPSGQGRVALTFDDGPHPDSTPRLLAELGRLGIPATHFVNGLHCEQSPALLREISASGHLIGNHGFVHRSLLWAGAAEQRESVLRTAAAVEHITGRRTDLFRPCHGRFNPWTRGVLHQTAHRGVLWSYLIGDWNAVDETTLWHRLESGLHDGAIILLHDGRPATSAVIRLLPRLAEAVAARGWQFVLLSSAVPSPHLDATP